MTWVGFISSGPMTYVAVDIGNRRALMIQRYCLPDRVPAPSHAPQIESSTPYNHNSPVQLTGGIQCVDHVRILPQSARQISRLVCPLNRFWSESFTPYENWEVSDTGSTVWLLLPHRATHGTVAGVFTGPVAYFGEAVLKFFAAK